MSPKDDEHYSDAPVMRHLQIVNGGFSWRNFFSVVLVICWACVCAWFFDRRREEADQNPDGEVDRFLTFIGEVDVKVIGSLFTFALVFRFNKCYDRWWRGRELWGLIIQQSLEFSEKVSLWIIDKSYADRLNRYIIVVPYACKAQLRGLSLTDPKESGYDLLTRGLLTQEEINYIEANPSWQPNFFLNLIRAVVAKVQIAEYTVGKTLLLPKSNKLHEKLFPALDKSVYDLYKTIGECVTTRAAGLPKSYDFMHHVFFWIYFLLASIVWAETIGWLAPIFVAALASIIMALISMGTALVDPFGTDIVDLPLEKFCEITEAQIRAIEHRNKQPEFMEFVDYSGPNINPSEG